MDYKEKYEKALVTARKLYNEAKANGYTSDMEDYETIFPELADSEDEKIRKDILDYCNNRMNNEFSHITIKQVEMWKSWLEKQGEQTSFNDTQEYLRGVDRVQNYEELTKFEKGFDRIADIYAHNKNKEGYNSPWYTKERAAEMLHWAKEELGLLEKQGEQKAELKFDIPEIKIKDDVSVTSRVEHISEELKPIADFVIDYSHWNLHKDEWNHPVPEVPLFRVLDALVQEGKLYQAACSCVKQKPEWSEEDEAMYYGVIETEQYMLDVVYGRKKFNVGCKSIKEECQKELDWLKSIRHRIFSNMERIGKDWKPSEEQMNALLWIIENTPKSVDINILLNSLYEQLKAL